MADDKLGGGGGDRSLTWIKRGERTEEPPVWNESDDHGDKPNSLGTDKKSEDPGFSQATQAGFTQTQGWNSTHDLNTSLGNLSEWLYESLERSHEILDADPIKKITDSELSIVMNDLSKKITHRGIYNLAHFVCDAKAELSDRLIGSLCRDMLLPTIITNEEPSRLLNAAITRCVGKFPEDVENLIFVPLLNLDMREMTAILSITSNLEIQWKRAYITVLSTVVNHLKDWHISILQDLLIPNLDISTREKVLHLLWRASYDFSRDKSYGKLILTILKTNPPVTPQQKRSFEDINAVHNTLFTKLINKMLET
ncbi:uncharacterized protein LOC105684232 isoform X2 [Athalia rosae]|uniref:uncharacterized protein LOC105684232 isoform X2 n=1 Tax=Athalia rosae TaxID=37344 RepID=UPI0020336C57|nr:uncharacterized protein LOC105684232 isoform X2 [Athalia rosae]